MSRPLPWVHTPTLLEGSTGSLVSNSHTTLYVAMVPLSLTTIGVVFSMTPALKGTE